MRIEFIIPGDPHGKVNMQPMKRGNHCLLFNPKSNKNYMALVQHCFGEKYAMVDGYLFGKDEPIDITIIANFKLQSVHFGKKGINQKGQDKLAGKIVPTVKPDLDNISKVILDALSGLCFYDDSQVVNEFIMKRYSVKPYVKVIIESYRPN